MDIKLIALVVVLLWSIGKVFFLKNSNSWLLFSRGVDGYLNPWFAFLSIFASLSGGFMVLGIVQVGYEGGLTGYIFGLSYLVGLPLLLWLIHRSKNKKILSQGMFGIDSLMFNKFGKNTLRSFYLITGILFAGVLGGQFIALKYFLSIFTGEISIFIIVFVGVVLTILYTIIFGFRGVIGNDIIQAILELLVAIIFPIFLFKHLMSNEEYNFIIDYNNISGAYEVYYPFLGGLFLLLSFGARADLWQRIRSVKPKLQSKVLICCGLVLTAYYFIMTACGSAIMQNESILELGSQFDPGSATVVLSERLINNGYILVICLSGILIAIFSSIDSYLNLTSVSLTKLFLWTNIPKLEGENLSEEENKILTSNARVVTIFTAIIAGIFAVIIPDIVDLMSTSFSLLGILIPLFFVANSTNYKLHDNIGTYTILSSLIILLISLPILKKLAFIPSLLIGYIVMAISYYYYKKRLAIK